MSFISIIPIMIAFILNDINIEYICFPLGTAISTSIIIPCCVTVQIYKISFTPPNVYAKNENELIIWYSEYMFKIIILIFSILNIVCYVGNYAIIQMSDGNTPLYWLVTEALLMIIRMSMWIIDSKHDNPPPIEIAHKGITYSNNIKWDGDVMSSDKFYEKLILVHGIIRLDEPDLDGRFALLEGYLYYIIESENYSIVAKINNTGMVIQYMKVRDPVNVEDWELLYQPDVYEQIKYAKYKNTLLNLYNLSVKIKSETAILYGHMSWKGQGLTDEKGKIMVFLNYKFPSSFSFNSVSVPYIMYLIEKYIRKNKNVDNMYQKRNFDDVRNANSYNIIF
jgi:hypothetical protein